MAKQWYSYSELGKALGIKPMSAKTRAQRNGWPIRKDNQGRPQVEVDLGDVVQHPARQPATRIVRRTVSEEPRQSVSDLQDRIAVLETALANKDNQVQELTKQLLETKDNHKEETDSLRDQLLQQAKEHAQEIKQASQMAQDGLNQVLGTLTPRNQRGRWWPFK